MHQRVAGIGPDDRRVAADPLGLEAVADRQAGRQPAGQRQGQLLTRAQAGVQGRRGQHQGIERAAPARRLRRQRLGRKARGHEATEAVAQQHEAAFGRVRPTGLTGLTDGVDDAGRVAQQCIGNRNVAAPALAAAMAAVVPAVHIPAFRVQHGRDVSVAVDVLAQTMHEEHLAARRLGGGGPVAQMELQAVVGGRHRRGVR